MTIDEKMRERIQEISLELCREMYGKDACPPLGTRFSQIEDDAVAVADAITREVMCNLLARQADHVPSGAVGCPDCGQACERENDVGREVLTRRGNVGWSEGEHHCTKCRRSFFPGDRQPGP